SPPSKLVCSRQPVPPSSSSSSPRCSRASASRAPVASCPAPPSRRRTATGTETLVQARAQLSHRGRFDTCATTCTSGGAAASCPSGDRRLLRSGLTWNLLLPPARQHPADAGVDERADEDDVEDDRDR